MCSVCGLDEVGICRCGNEKKEGGVQVGETRSAGWQSEAMMKLARRLGADLDAPKEEAQMLQKLEVLQDQFENIFDSKLPEDVQKEIEEDEKLIRMWCGLADGAGLADVDMMSDLRFQGQEEASNMQTLQNLQNLVLVGSGVGEKPDVDKLRQQLQGLDLSGISKLASSKVNSETKTKGLSVLLKKEPRLGVLVGAAWDPCTACLAAEPNWKDLASVLGALEKTL